MEYSYLDHTRWALLYENPNFEATLLVGLSCLAWIPALCNKQGFFASLVLQLVIAVWLIATYSRGGMIAYVVAQGIFAVGYRHKAKSKKALLLVAAVILLGVFSYLNESSRRMTTGLMLQDESVTNRLDIWIQAPRMMVDAPWGWGLKQSGTSFANWYQDLGRHEDYLSMVNSHLTLLAEVNWLFRYLYLSAWLFAFFYAFQLKKYPLKVMCLACTAGFAVSALFSSLLHAISLWLIPGMLLVIALAQKDRKGPALKRAGIAALPLTAVLFILGTVSPRAYPVNHKGPYVKIGDAAPSHIILSNHDKVSGRHVGHTIRTEQMNLIFAKGSKNIPGLKDTPAVVIGALPKSLKEVNKLIVINPLFAPEGIEQSGLPGKATIDLLCGEFHSEKSRWEAFAEKQDRLSLYLVDGAGTFMGDWPRLIKKGYAEYAAIEDESYLDIDVESIPMEDAPVEEPDDLDAVINAFKDL